MDLSVRRGTLTTVHHTPYLATQTAPLTVESAQSYNGELIPNANAYTAAQDRITMPRETRGVCYGHPPPPPVPKHEPRIRGILSMRVRNITPVAHRTMVPPWENIEDTSRIHQFPVHYFLWAF